MKLFAFTPNTASDCTVTAFLQSDIRGGLERQRPAIIICPGGGYSGLTAREGEPLARKYFAACYNVFVLEYSVGEKARDFRPLLQLAATMAHVRRHAEEWGVDPNRIAVCGFSAGGHLAASLGTLHNNERFRSVCPEQGNIRPDAMVLCYPVISAQQPTHRGSIENVSGNAPEGSDAWNYWSLENHVDAQTPPAFLWHTASDEVVSVKNSLKLANALTDAKIPFEMHIFPEGNHGSCICTAETRTENPYNARWVGLSITWLNKILRYEE